MFNYLSHGHAHSAHLSVYVSSGCVYNTGYSGVYLLPSKFKEISGISGENAQHWIRSVYSSRPSRFSPKIGGIMIRGQIIKIHIENAIGAPGILLRGDYDMSDIHRNLFLKFR